MPRLSNLLKAQAIGQLQAGVPQKDVAARFGVSASTISRLRAKFLESGEVKDRPRSGRPKKTTHHRITASTSFKLNPSLKQTGIHY